MFNVVKINSRSGGMVSYRVLLKVLIAGKTRALEITVGRCRGAL
jgi:hypothetical protein